MVACFLFLFFLFINHNHSCSYDMKLLFCKFEIFPFENLILIVCFVVSFSACVLIHRKVVPFCFSPFFLRRPFYVLLFFSSIFFYISVNANRALVWFYLLLCFWILISGIDHLLGYCLSLSLSLFLSLTSALVLLLNDLSDASTWHDSTIIGFWNAGESLVW